MDEIKLRDLIPNVSAAARTLGLSTKTLFVWIKQNRVPPKRVIKLANALDREIHELLPFAERTVGEDRSVQKTPEDLEVLNSHYMNGTTPDTHSHRMVLKTWGDRWPLLYQTLHEMKDGELTTKQAAERLGVVQSSIPHLRKRYGIEMPKRKKAPPKQPKKKDKNLDHALDVVAGRVTARDAAKNASASLRSLHRYITSLIDPRTLNELAHWSPSFRLAFALEVSRKSPKVVEKWRKLAQDRRLLLKKRTKMPEPVENWRETPMWRMAVALLTGEADLETIAAGRGGEPAVIDGLITNYLRDLGLSCRGLSVHHQAAAAEVIMALQSHYRAVPESDGSNT